MSTSSRRWWTAMATATGTFIALDAVWIGAVARSVYESSIPHLMAESMKPAPAAVFYLGYLAETVHLAVRPSQRDRGGGRGRGRPGGSAGARWAQPRTEGMSTGVVRLYSR